MGLKVSGVEPLSREETLAALARVLDMAFSRMDNRYLKNAEKVQWARIVVAGTAAAAPLLRDKEIEEIKADIEELQGRMSNGAD